MEIRRIRGTGLEIIRICFLLTIGCSIIDDTRVCKEAVINYVPIRTIRILYISYESGKDNVEHYKLHEYLAGTLLVDSLVDYTR